MSFQNKILIIGASELQLPAIKKAKDIGLCVGVVDYNSNAAGVGYADKFYNVSTNDIQGVLSVSKEFQPNGVMTLATDMPVKSVAYAAFMLGLPSISYDTAVKSTDKAEMIKVFKKNGVEIPWFYIINKDTNMLELSNRLIYPCIMKPTGNSGSRGVILIHDQKEFKEAYDYSRAYSKDDKLIVEEYLEGHEVSVEALFVGGKPNIIAVTDKLTTGAPHFIEIGHSQHSFLTAKNVNSIIGLAIRAAKALGIEFGPIHAEIMLTSNGPKMIELGARLGGGFITSHLVPLSTGIDMVKETIKASIGVMSEEIMPELKPKFNKGSAIRFFTAPPGTIKAIYGTDEVMKIKNVKEFNLFKRIGDKINTLKSGNDRLGYVIAQSETPQGAVAICENVLDVIKIETV